MLDKIIDSCNYVVNNSKNVKINYEKLDNFIKDIDCKNLKNWLLFNPNNLLEFDISTLINFLLIFESIDYCFGEIQNGKLLLMMEVKKMDLMHCYIVC